jgi:hypothetical protein
MRLLLLAFPLTFIVLAYAGAFAEWQHLIRDVLP